MREKLLDAAESLVQCRGLSAVTFQDLADAVGLRKPSVFHHIRNKEELVLLLIERCGSKYGAQYAAIIDKDIPAPEKLRQVAETFEDGLVQGRHCLMATIGGGRDTLPKSATDELQKAADNAISRFSDIFSQGKDEGSLEFEGTPKHAALGFCAMLQGLQTLCRATGDTKAFHKAVTTYIESLTAHTQTH